MGTITPVSELCVPIAEEVDVAIARQRTRDMASVQNLDHTATEALVTAVSEITRNIVVHAGHGDLVLRAIRRPGGHGLVAIASDNGPGIPDTAMALKDGYSTAGGLGLGLSGARRLVDEFDLISIVGKGTIVTLIQWAK